MTIKNVKHSKSANVKYMKDIFVRQVLQSSQERLTI